MSRSARPDLANALSACSAEIATAVREASAHLRGRGVGHVLCGGLAVGAYARPRAVTQVDFLVGDDAFERDGLISRPWVSRVGLIPVEMVSLLPNLRALASSLEVPVESNGVPVASPEALIAMKLVAHRLQDKADIAAVLESGAVDLAVCRAWLAERGFDVALFDDIAASVTRGVR